jgi:hypothetical protein
LAFQWNDTSRANNLMKSKINQILCPVVTLLTPQGLSNVVWGLANMGCSWDNDISYDVKSDIEVRIQQIVRESNEQALSTLIWSLGQLRSNLTDMTSSELMLAIDKFTTSRLSRVYFHPGTVTT